MIGMETIGAEISMDSKIAVAEDEEEMTGAVEVASTIEVAEVASMIEVWEETAAAEE